jgi:hypothetical protein
MGLLALNERRLAMWKIDSSTQKVRRVDDHHRVVETRQ